MTNEEKKKGERNMADENVIITNICTKNLFHFTAIFKITAHNSIKILLNLIVEIKIAVGFPNNYFFLFNNPFFKTLSPQSVYGIAFESTVNLKKRIRFLMKKIDRNQKKKKIISDFSEK